MCADLLADNIGLAIAVDRHQLRGILLEFGRHLFHDQQMVHQAGSDRTAQDRVIAIV